MADLEKQTSFGIINNHETKASQMSDASFMNQITKEYEIKCLNAQGLIKKLSI